MDLLAETLIKNMLPIVLISVIVMVFLSILSRFGNSSSEEEHRVGNGDSIDKKQLKTSIKHPKGKDTAA